MAKDREGEDQSSTDEAPIERAARSGPLPGLAEQDAFEQGGEDGSRQAEKDDRSLFGVIVAPEESEGSP